MDTIKNFFETLGNELDDNGDITEILGSMCYIRANDANKVKTIINECCENMQMFYDLEENEDSRIIKINISYNACIVCKVNMGLHNPRQYCKKYYCPEMLNQ